jgi:Protein of Unknown function (DUF2784)
MTSITLLADFIVVIHLIYMAVVIFGQLGIMIGHHLGWRWVRNPWFRIAHLVMIMIVAYEAVNEIDCPLTVWEIELRVEAGQMSADWATRQNRDIEDPSLVARLARNVLMCPMSWAPVLQASYYFFAGLVMATLILVSPRFHRRAAPIAVGPSSEGITVRR